LHPFTLISFVTKSPRPELPAPPKLAKIRAELIKRIRP
jgi:hypothetical protein